MARQDIEIQTADGVAKARLFGDPAGGGPGVLFYMDAFGPRPALDGMAERLAGEGYVVLMPDLFHRNAPYGPFDAKTGFVHEDSRAALTALLSGTTQAMTRRDAPAFISALRKAGVSGRIGVVGYCMGGARALNAAIACPDDIVAAASFHGGNLASDAPDSPHQHANGLKARVYVGVAGVDRSFPPEQSARLAEALRTAEVDHIVENYVDMAHGWAVPDHNVYDERGAERHWKRLLWFFAETLKQDLQR